MRTSIVMASSILLLLAACRSDVEELPKRRIIKAIPAFADHTIPAEEVFHGRPEPPDPATSPMARRYRSAIAGGMKQGVNFAGHYVFISWGCGRSCQQSAVVDATTGRVYPGPEGSSGYRYTTQSLLLIVNPPDGQPPENSSAAKAEYWLWRTDGFHRIDLD